VKDLLEKWREAWPRALEIWSPYTRLSEPKWARNKTEDKALGVEASFACIRINDHSVRISLSQIKDYHLEDYAEEILAHEIGHHVFCPANLLEAGKAIALASLALPTFENQAASIVNMWEDLLINDRLVRLHEQRHAEIYERINSHNESEPSKLWRLYMRAFEILWGLKPGRLKGTGLEPHEEGDAYLVARMVRVYGKDWMQGVGGFAALCLPYLQAQTEPAVGRVKLVFDTDGLGEGCEVPLGLLNLEGLEIVHPSEDPNIVDSLPGKGKGESDIKTEALNQMGGSLGQSREPFLFGQVLEALGMKLDRHEAAVKFYREKALPHLIPFPTQELEFSKEPLMEGLEPWDVGNPTEEIDWLESVMLSPVVVPGMTTVKRTWGEMGGAERDKEPLDLDLYVDCSGSIPNPQQSLSYLALAGTIVVLSAMRTGARVQATLWSGPGQFDKTPGFVSDERAVLRVLTGYLGGGTAFPNHILRTTYQERKESERPVHILVLSDDGIDTMRNKDELGNEGLGIARMALEKARGGGTMVLNLYSKNFFDRAFAKSAIPMGWELFRVTDWSELTQFAREFARLKYGRPGKRLS
jgi:hypothetical protein